MLTQAIIKTICILIVACFCAWAGAKISRRQSAIWLFAFWLAFIPILFVILLHRIALLAYQPVFRCLAHGSTEYFVMACCVPFVFGILVPRLPMKRQQYVVGLLAVLVTIYFVVPPFLDPALLYASIEMDTWIENDVCLQTTEYTCGAASAVTALKCFGIEASEKELAFASSTSRTWGTSEYKLARAIEKLYSDSGIECRSAMFENPQELKDRCPVIVIVKYKPMVDHFITVLAVEEDSVIVGDPLSGKETLTYSEFAEKWRYVGIVVSQHKDYRNEI